MLWLFVLTCGGEKEVDDHTIYEHSVKSTAISVYQARVKVITATHQFTSRSLAKTYPGLFIEVRTKKQTNSDDIKQRPSRFRLTLNQDLTSSNNSETIIKPTWLTFNRNWTIFRDKEPEPDWFEQVENED